MIVAFDREVKRGCAPADERLSLERAVVRASRHTPTGEWAFSRNGMPKSRKSRGGCRPDADRATSALGVGPAASSCVSPCFGSPLIRKRDYTLTSCRQHDSLPAPETGLRRG